MNTFSQNSSLLINPFSINIAPIECLLLVNFENDPDSLYIGFEPQKFNDNIHGKGYLVIAWRKDGKVDVYHEKNLSLDSSTYDIAGNGLANMLERDFISPKLEINETGVNAYFKFTDIHNREVIISISESNTKERKPFGLLAPMGDAVENPSSMPLVMLQDFYFVRRKGSEILLKIDGKEHKTDNLPLPIDRSKMTFIRYSPKPLIATLNHAYSGKMTMLKIEENQNVLNYDNYEIDLIWDNGKSYIKSITKHNEVHPVKISFDKAFPNLACFDNNTEHSGEFKIESHPSIGKVKGVYHIETYNNEIIIKLVPSKGWIPQKSKFSLGLLYRIAKVFKKWPSTYEWTAKVQENQSKFKMESKWKRIYVNLKNN